MLQSATETDTARISSGAKSVVVWYCEEKNTVRFPCSRCGNAILVHRPNMHSSSVPCKYCRTETENPIGSRPVNIKIAVPDDWEVVDIA